MAAWASAIALGIKRIETRSWATNFSGPIAIHAAQRRSAVQRAAFDELLTEHEEIRRAFEDGLEMDFDCLPFGAIVATAKLVRCVPTDQIEALTITEQALGDYRPGRFGWILEEVKPLAKALPWRGGQRTFNVEF